MNYRNEVTNILDQLVRRNVPMLKYPTDTLSLSHMAPKPVEKIAALEKVIAKDVPKPAVKKVRRTRTLATIAKEEIL